MPQLLSALAGGCIINPQTSRNQIIGAQVWGIGMTLYEESALDHTFGRFMNHYLAEHHVPVHA